MIWKIIVTGNECTEKLMSFILTIFTEGRRIEESKKEAFNPLKATL